MEEAEEEATRTIMIYKLLWMDNHRMMNVLIIDRHVVDHVLHLHNCKCLLLIVSFKCITNVNKIWVLPFWESTEFIDHNVNVLK